MGADHSHPDHQHGSLLRHRRVAAIMLAYAIVELVAWAFARNPLILADAGHNLADVGFPLASGWMLALAGRTRRHSLSCYAPTLFSFAVFPVSLILLIVIERTQGTDLAQLSGARLASGLVLASGSLLVNLYAAGALDRHHGAVEQATWTHLVLDAAVAGSIIIGTAFSLFGLKSAPAACLWVLIVVFAFIIVVLLVRLPTDLHYGRPHPHTNAPV